MTTPSPASLQSGEYIGLTAKPASEYFTESQYQHSFAQYRYTKYTHNRSVRSENFWTEQDEHKLVDGLWRDWYGEAYNQGDMGLKTLNLDALETRPLRKRELRPFKIDYDTYQEIKLRLGNTVISIKGNPFLVSRIGRLSSNKFRLAVQDAENIYQVDYADLKDLRTIPPMYIPGGRGGWLCRFPGKIYQQGLNKHNTYIHAVDGATAISSFDANNFLSTFNSRRDLRWDTTLEGLVTGGEVSHLRLSDEVAVKRDRNKVLACYRGRPLGTIREGDVLVKDEDDLLQGWIEKSVKAVGLELRA